MADNVFSGGPIDDQVAHVVSNILSKNEDRVEKFMKRLNVGTRSDAHALRRLDRFYLAAAGAAGVAKGVGTVAQKRLRIPRRLFNRITSVGLLSVTALYILAHAHVRGISSSDERVHDAVRDALVVSAALPVGQVIFDNLARFMGPGVGLPTDPRTWFVVAAGAAGGGIATNTLAKGIIDSVYQALDGTDAPIDSED